MGSNDASLKVPLWTRPRADGRLDLVRMPFSPEHRDVLPGPMDWNGRRCRWVGIGWVDEGKADGTEPLVFAVAR